MDKHRFSEPELNNLSKEALVKMYLQLADSFDVLKSQNEAVLKQMESLKEDLAILKQSAFGRKTEKRSNIDENQLSIDLIKNLVLNEAESLTKEETPQEPDFEEVVVRRKKPKGKRSADLQGIEVVVDPMITIPKERLQELFPGGYYQLPDEVYKDLEYVPAKVVAHEHHIAVYAGKHGEGIVRADRPERLLKNSILTTSLAAAVFNSKYVNAIPLYRLSEEFVRRDIIVSRQVMANWMIQIAERYLGPVYRAMHRHLLQSTVIHCDETPFKLIRDGKECKNSKAYMWVYHATPDYGVAPVFLYEYQPGRSSIYPKEFLKDFRGTLVTDGYRVYHKLADDSEGELVVAGCWAHAKRKFAEIVNAIGPGSTSYAPAEEAVKRISTIYHVDNMAKGKSAQEILMHRQTSVKPLIDSYFEWVDKYLMMPLDKGGKLYHALDYSRNQKEYLCRFLDDPVLPLDNNDAERSIKKFCVGKHNWHIIDTPNGAKASAMLYSIAETAKANGLKPYDYFKYLLDQILLHVEDDPATYIDKILPWSQDLPQETKNIKMNNY